MLWQQLTNKKNHSLTDCFVDVDDVHTNLNTTPVLNCRIWGLKQYKRDDFNNDYHYCFSKNSDICQHRKGELQLGSGTIPLTRLKGETRMTTQQKSAPFWGIRCKPGHIISTRGRTDKRLDEADNLLPEGAHSRNWIKPAAGPHCNSYKNNSALWFRGEMYSTDAWIKERGGLQYKSTQRLGYTHFTDNKKMHTHALGKYINPKPGGVGINRSRMLTLGQNNEKTSLPDTFK